MKKLVLAALLGGFFIGQAEASWIKEPRLLTYEVSAQKAKPAKKAAPREALVRSGLMDDFGIFTRPVEDGLRGQGYNVTRIPWWAAKPGVYYVEVGHSLGADKVLSDGGKRVIAIDPTIKNQGCAPGSDCTVYYGPANKFPLIVCCGGYPARGAKNIPIPFGHTRAPSIALDQILAQTRASWTSKTLPKALKSSRPQSYGGTISRQDIPG